MIELKLNHFNINVVDLNKSISFYERNLDLHILREKKDPNNRYHIVYLADKYQSVTIELTWVNNNKEKYDLGDNEIHIAFSTNDFEKTYKRHYDNNVIVYENHEMGVYFISDPDGYWIEIVKEK